MDYLTATYWEERYQEGYTGWDIGHVSGAMKHIIDQLNDRKLRILVPGAGNGYEVAYLWEKGFRNVYLLDWASTPLSEFARRHPDFPENQLIRANFFELEEQFDLILEQTFFCALTPDKRPDYVNKMNKILVRDGILRGILFKVPMFKDRPPFGGSIEEYQALFVPKFDINFFADCIYSEPARLGTEVEFKVTKK